ncbi:hypothetical protein NMY22_g5441 [Coprinellus aureogranulatus]|nr:hypothetical protein NMY22_g5441 [Coprinellus aureogranulatus]
MGQIGIVRTDAFWVVAFGAKTPNFLQGTDKAKRPPRIEAIYRYRVYEKEEGKPRQTLSGSDEWEEGILEYCEDHGIYRMNIPRMNEDGKLVGGYPRVSKQKASDLVGEVQGEGKDHKYFLGGHEGSGEYPTRSPKIVRDGCYGLMKPIVKVEPVEQSVYVQLRTYHKNTSEDALCCDCAGSVAGLGSGLNSLSQTAGA